jgi:two-component system NtrC family sensor kinase
MQIQRDESTKGIGLDSHDSKEKMCPDIENLKLKEELKLSVSEPFDESPVPTFVIDSQHIVTFWNKACERMTGIPAERIIGTRDHWRPFYSTQQPLLADLIVSGNDEAAIKDSDAVMGITLVLPQVHYTKETFFPDMGDNGLWFCVSASPLSDASGKVVGAIETLQDISRQKTAESELQKVLHDMEQLVSKRTAQLAQANDRLEDDIRKREEAEDELLRRNAELIELNEKFSLAQEQLIQSEKLASIGQLAAGVAHEINNPIGYIFSNFGSLESYIAQLLEMLQAYEQAESCIASPEVRAQLASVRERVELDYVKEDMPVLLSESKEGIVRVRKIVQDLKDFSHVDSNHEWQWVDLHRGIDSTLNIVNNEVKYKADLIKEYGEIPEVECLASQINQVVMNIVVNAAHAIEGERGKITIRTGTKGENVWIEISDTGSGIPNEILPRIFDPFFTTKPVGTGTGLGLALSYGIIQKHQGRINVTSELGIGTCFRITLPIRRNLERGREKG